MTPGLHCLRERHRHPHRITCLSQRRVHQHRVGTGLHRLRRFTRHTQASVDHHALGALMANRDGELHQVEPRDLPGIVDRIGGGDAFAAGVLHGLASGWDDLESLRFGHAAGCLKHAVPGDFNLCDADDVLALVRGERLDVKR